MPLKRPRSTSRSPPSSSVIDSAVQHGHTADSKRQRKNAHRDAVSHRIGDIFAYQEIFLRILSFLSPTELASVQCTSKYWSRMSVDQQLWKRLYLARYPHPHHARMIQKPPSSGSSTPKLPLRPIARLPSRAFPPPSPSRSPSAASLAGDPGIARGKAKTSGVAVPLDDRDEAPEVGYGVRNDGVDWKIMLRLGTNWANGNALSQSSISLPPSPSPSVRSSQELDPAAARSSDATACSEQHIALFPSLICTSNPTSPLVHVHRSSLNTTVRLAIIPPPPGWSSPRRPDSVTAICADQSVSVVDDREVDSDRTPSARLGVFYQSGGFVVLLVSLDGDRVNWAREAVHPAQNRPRSIRRRATSFTPIHGDPVVLATMFYPTLITCTLGFHLSVYSLTSQNGEPSKPLRLSTMHSDVSFHPAALSLFPSDQNTSTSASDPSRSFRAALTYCTPLYPASWTVAVQEFGIELDDHQAGDVWRGECYNVGRGDEDDAADDVWPRKVRQIVGVKGNKAVGVGTDGRWCVLAGEDNQIQVYSLPPPSPSISPPPRKTFPIVHSQTLLAHSAAVTSISLNAGRCVSGGRDGRVLVWELDEDEVDQEGRIGRTVGYVEVKRGGRRWKGPSGPEVDDVDEDRNEVCRNGLPHPASISTAARSLFLPRPPDVIDDRPPAIRQLAFDEEKIVGLVRQDMTSGPNVTAEVMKVWSFNG